MKRRIVIVGLIAVAAVLGFEAGKWHSDLQPQTARTDYEVANIEATIQKLEHLKPFILKNEQYSGKYVESISASATHDDVFYVTLLQDKQLDTSGSVAKPLILRICHCGNIDALKDWDDVFYEGSRNKLIRPPQ